MTRTEMLAREQTQFLVDAYLEQSALLDSRIYVARLTDERDARRSRLCLTENDFIIVLALEGAMARLSL